MIVTVIDLVRLFRQQIDDITEGWEDDDELSLLFSNDEAVEYANEAVYEYLRRRLLIDDVTTELVDLALVAGQPDYPRDPRIYQIHRIAINGCPVDKVFREDLDIDHPDWETEMGTPTCYYEYQNTLNFVPVPTADALARLSVYRLPVAALSWTSRDTPIVDVRPEDRYSLHLWMLHLAWSKQDADTADPKAAERSRQQFTELVGERVSSGLERNRQLVLTNRPLRTKAYY